MTAVVQPSLFEQLKAEPSPLYLPPREKWCGQDEEIIALWLAHGIPADLSTVEYACAMLLVLHKEYHGLLEQLSVLGGTA
jgi:hypothetical protein